MWGLEATGGRRWICAIGFRDGDVRLSGRTITLPRPLRASKDGTSTGGRAGAGSSESTLRTTNSPKASRPTSSATSRSRAKPPRVARTGISGRDDAAVSHQASSQSGAASQHGMTAAAQRGSISPSALVARTVVRRMFGGSLGADFRENAVPSDRPCTRASFVVCRRDEYAAKARVAG